jgi:DNA adenine methylase
VVVPLGGDGGSASVLPQLRPFLKWAGGKGRLLPKILPFVPARFGDYYEPFLGGGAMFFAVRDRMNGVAHLHDLNEQLTNVWQCIQQDPQSLLAAMNPFTKHDSEEFYYAQRLVNPPTLVEQAARFVYLNQTSWNGLWRVNKWGQFNVPWGRRAFRGLDPVTVFRIAEALVGASITAEDFRASLQKPQAGDFVYLDPPYLPLSDTSKFYLYTERRFRAPDLVELADLCHDLTEREVLWMMSNRDTEQIRKLFSDHTIIRFTTRRSVAAQNRRDVELADSPEALILGRELR